LLKFTIVLIKGNGEEELRSCNILHHR